MVTFSETGIDAPYADQKRYCAVVGVISPVRVASMQERIEARQFEVADALADNAKARISRWGSDFHGDDGPIHKSQAMSAVTEALSSLKKRLATTKEPTG